MKTALPLVAFWSLLAISPLQAETPKLEPPKPAGLQPLEAGAAPNPADPALASNRPFNCPRLDKGDQSGAMALGKLYQGEDGWFFRAGDLTEDAALPPPMLKDIERLAKAMAERGSVLVLAPTATRGQMGRMRLGSIDAETVFRPENADKADAEFRAAAKKRGLVVISPPPSDPDPGLYYKRDHHWSPRGAQLFAKDLAGTILALPAVKDLPRQTYATTAQQTIPLESVMGQQIATLCDEPLPSEDVTLYRTEAKAESADDLFADEPAEGAPSASSAPAIAIAGTSFSAQERFNLEGFVMQETGLSVANHSISGGAAYAALINYLGGPAWRQTPSPMVVWEFQYNSATIKEAPAAFRQIIPAAKGLCTGEAVAATVKAPLAPGAEIMLDVPEAKAGSLYAHIRFSDSSVRQVMTRFLHKDGEIEDVPLIRHARLGPAEAFFVETSQEIAAPLAQLSVSASFPTAVEAEITLCHDRTSTP
jgi:alginate biosynthesis protein AlgX